MYAKVINNEIVFARIEFEGWTNIETGELIKNPVEEDFIKAGYQKVIQRSDNPQEGKDSIPYYEVNNGEIVQLWKYEDVSV